MPRWMGIRVALRSPSDPPVFFFGFFLEISIFADGYTVAGAGMYVFLARLLKAKKRKELLTGHTQALTN